MKMIYRVKAVIRWVRYQLRVGVSYHEYGAGVVEYGYLGWYEQFGQTIAFRDVDNKVQYLW